jgi:sn-glycerol 3-phosphate transport system permease protein
MSMLLHEGEKETPLKSSRRRKRRSEWPLALLMLAPSVIILSVFVLYPLVQAIFLGTKSCDALGRSCTTNGWDQYIDTARSPEFKHALWVTIKFAVLTVPLGLVLGVGLAVLADKYIRGIGFFRTVFSSTVATSVAVASLMWLFLLQPQRGLLANTSWIIDMFPVVKQPGLLRDPDTALFSVAMSSMWASLGFTFIVVTAGLQSIPKELQESAYVDGAGAFRRLTNVTLPLLAPTLLFIGVVLTTRAFQAYGEIDLLTQGGPKPENSTTTMTYLIYGSTSVIKNNAGRQSTVAILLFLVMLVLSAVQLRGLGRRVHYGS